MVNLKLVYNGTYSSVYLSLKLTMYTFTSSFEFKVNYLHSTCLPLIKILLDIRIAVDLKIFSGYSFVSF